MENWKPIAGFEGLYEVSDLGRVRSLSRLVMFTSKRGKRCERAFKGRVLSLSVGVSGYFMLQLYDGGLARATALHIVVAETFHGSKPSSEHEVRHLDGTKLNCAAANLAWATHTENEADKVVHGTLRRGEDNAQSKLSAEDVAKIRRRVGERQQDLADEFGCTFSNISAIQLRKSWRHV